MESCVENRLRKGISRPIGLWRARPFLLSQYVKNKSFVLAVGEGASEQRVTLIDVAHDWGRLGLFGAL